VEIGGSYSGSEYGDLSIHGSVLLSTALGCQVYRSTTQRLDNGAWVPIAYDTEIEDTDGCWSSANDTRLIAQRDGTYVISASVAIPRGTTDRKLYYIGIRKNGSDWQHMNMRDSNAASSFVNCSISCAVVMEAGDYVEVVVQQNSGAAQNTEAADTTKLHNNSASFYRIP